VILARRAQPARPERKDRLVLLEPPEPKAIKVTPELRQLFKSVRLRPARQVLLHLSVIRELRVPLFLILQFLPERRVQQVQLERKVRQERLEQKVILAQPAHKGRKDHRDLPDQLEQLEQLDRKDQQAQPEQLVL
jgi:hypothetical protein